MTTKLSHGLALFIFLWCVNCGNDRIVPVPIPCDAGETSAIFDGGHGTTDGGIDLPDGGRHRNDGGLLPEISPTRDKFGTTLWTEQVCTEVFASPNAWTLLQQDLGAERRHEPPLQGNYVTRFATLENMIGEAVSAYPQIGRAARSLSLSAVWPLWEADESWPERFRTGIEELQQIDSAPGYAVRLVLHHKESTPAALYARNPEQSGWAHPNARTQFLAYVNRVLTELADTIPAGSTIYLSLEAETAIWEGFLGDGKWPPGGTNLGRAFATALVNFRDALRQAASFIRAAGYRPLVGVSVAPLLPGQRHMGEALLEYLRTWWLADSLILGACRSDMDPFDRHCIREGGNVLGGLGITFYGGIWSHSNRVDFGMPGTSTVPLALLVHNVSPNPVLFGQVLGEAKMRYPGTAIEVAEIGISEPDLNTHLYYIIQYKLAMLCHSIEHATFHTLFMGTAEFLTGYWQFGFVDNCSEDLECILTERGEKTLREISYPPIPHPCNP